MQEYGGITVEKIIYTVNEVAELFMTNRNKIYQLIDNGELKVIKVLGRIKISAAEIEIFLVENSEVKQIKEYLLKVVIITQARKPAKN